MDRDLQGLNRYDGTRIKNYGRQDLGVKSDYINVLAEDSAGNVLIGTDNGIVIYDYRKDSFRQPLQAELLDDRIYSIQNDSKGISWIGSRAQGLFSYDPETDAVSKIDLKNPEGKLVRDIYRIVIDRNDKMYVPYIATTFTGSQATSRWRGSQLPARQAISRRMTSRE